MKNTSAKQTPNDNWSKEHISDYHLEMQRLKDLRAAVLKSQNFKKNKSK